MHSLDGCARRQAPPRAKLRHGLGLHRGHRAVMRLDSTTKQEGDRASTSEAEIVSPCATILVSDQYRKLRRSFCFLGRKKGKRLEGSGNQSTFEAAVTKWAKALRLPLTAAARRHTAHGDPRPVPTSSRESSCRRIFWAGFDEAIVPVDYIHILLHFVFWLCRIPPEILSDVVALCVYLLRRSGRRRVRR